MNQNLMDNQNDEIFLSKNSSITNSPSTTVKRKKFPAKQIFNVWHSLKSLKKLNQTSLVKSIRNSPRFRRKRFNGNKHVEKNALDEQFSFSNHRLTASHPELSYHEGLAQLSNYQSFDDLNLITIHHNSENYISDNIEFHRTECNPVVKYNDDLVCGGCSNEISGNNLEINQLNSSEKDKHKSIDNRTSYEFKVTGSENVIKSQLSFGDTSTPTSFFSKFRSNSPNLGSLSNSPKNFNKKLDKSICLPSNSITTTSCSTFLPKRPHSSLNYNDSTSKRTQYKQTEAFSMGEEDLLFDTISEHQSLNCNSVVNCSTPSKRRDSFLLKLLKKRKSTERNPLDRTNYEYYNQSLDEDYENSISQNHQEQETNQVPLYQFYLLEIYLNSCSNLRAKDRAGTSDPYVKFKIANKVLFKSRIIYKNLNPKFDEFLTIPIDNLLDPVQIKVYDYDFGFTDDFLGAAQIDLTQLSLNEPEELVLRLTENGKPTDPEEDWGTIELCCTLLPKTLAEREQYYNKDYRLWTDSKKHKTQEWDSVVNIVLIEAKNLPAKDSNGLADPYVRFKLGNEKYKSKVVYKNLNPEYNEQFDLHTFPNQSKVLEILVYDNNSFQDEFIGKNAINLNCLNKEETHELIVKLDGLENAELLLLLTISGMKPVDDVTYSDYQFLSENYSLNKSFQNDKLNDVGFLVVKVIKAEDLLAADFSGKSDPFVVLELVNNRLQTNTEYKTLDPIWNKIFEFRVRDVNENLLIKVYDEDSDKNDFLGQCCIPLLSFKNGQIKWYQLKDQTGIKSTKGRIQLQLTLFYNLFRAAVKTISPKDKKILKQEIKFKRIIFLYNVNRMKFILMDIYLLINFVKSCFQWESKLRSLSAMIIFCLVTIFFQPYMLPLFVLMIFLKNYVKLYFAEQSKDVDLNQVDQNLYDENDEDDDDKGKKTFKEKIQILQETSAQIQNVLGDLASFGERIYNTLNYSVPFLSLLAIIALTTLTIVLYLIPIRFLVLIWGLNKFTKKLRCDTEPNNELLDFLSRVPDRNDLMLQREIPVQTHRDSPKGKKKKN